MTDEKGVAGNYAHIFNAPRDSLSQVLDAAPLVGINMDQALEDGALGPPVVAHIAQAIYRSAESTQGFNIFIDEAANLLRNEGFKALATQMFREYRKLGGAVGMAFQDPAALFNSGGSEALLENASTLIFLPNARISPEALARFNLNQEQEDFITGDSFAGKGRRALIVKQDSSSGYSDTAILDVDLSPLGQALRYYRAGAEANHDLEQLKAEYGASWQVHI